MRIVVLHHTDGEWAADVPSLPGCTARGKTREETLHCITTAMQEWIDEARHNSLPVPTDDFTTFISDTNDLDIEIKSMSNVNRELNESQTLR